MVPFRAVVQRSFVIIGRQSGCDVELEHPTVSGRHARLSWEGDRILVEDLGSANGVWVDDERVPRALVRPGDPVTLGDVPLPWGASALEPFLSHRSHGERSEPPSVAGDLARSTGRIVGVFVLAGLLVLGALWLTEPGRNMIKYAVLDRTPEREADEQSFVRTIVRPQVVRALASPDPSVLALARRAAPTASAPPSIDRLVELWSFVHDRWRMTVDPRGRDVLSIPREVIARELSGDADDFALFMVALVVALGGEARLVFMEGSRGGRAYAEACVRQDPALVARGLARAYRGPFAYTARSRARVAFRASIDCPMWLNLDVNGGVPGGDYEPERWAVATRSDGRVEPLAVLPGPTATEGSRRAPVATAPREVLCAPAPR
jgi:transglutaminase-like putative cysteine protease